MRGDAYVPNQIVVYDTLYLHILHKYNTVQ